MTCIAELDDYSGFLSFFFFLKDTFLFLKSFLLCGLFQMGLFDWISADNVIIFRQKVAVESRSRNEAFHPVWVWFFSFFTFPFP